MTQTRILNFNGRWRSYQARILDSLDAHLSDNKLHVVAAPGAGKTTLGIEVIGRLGRPALVLCPTNTIKHQWRDRICSSFLKKEDYGLVSTNIREPKYITVVTYQALLAAFCGTTDDDDLPQEADEEQDDKDTDSICSSDRFRKDKADEIVRLLADAQISLLCFDEAHHLRKEWWKALIYLNEHLKPRQTLALTATPPYDVDANEWKRYQELCGDIDEVISIPELVKNGDLCPHQDYICLSQLKAEEREMLKRHTEHVRTLMATIKGDKELLDYFAGRHFLTPDDADIEQIFDAPEFYVAVASLLSATGYTIPTQFLQLFDASQKDIPDFDVKSATAFLNGFLYPKDETLFADVEAKQTEYQKMASRLGLVANKKVVLDEDKKVQRQIASSLGKLDSIVDIVRLEHEQLGTRLRMVILTDFIRIDDIACSSLGVVPIWAKLTNTFRDIPIGVLCGSLILLPENKSGQLYQLLAANDIATDAVTLGRFKDMAGFVRVTPKESVRNHIVRLVTEMFNAGDITVLIGTQALLGEGWDAPSINSLILSSTVCSYMLSNQMRGRAIRIDKNNPDKVSNIWHLATVDEDGQYTYDLNQLATRFEGFEAPSYYDTHEIVSGIERITRQVDSDEEPFGAMVARVKTLTLQLAKNREMIRKWWDTSLYLGYGNNKLMRLSTGVDAEVMTVKSLAYTTYKYIFMLILLAVLFGGYLLLRFPPAIAMLLFTALIVVAAFFLIRTAVKYFRTGSVSRVMRQIAIVILETMSHQGIIKSSIKKAGLSVKERNGMCFVTCTNLPADENNLFIHALQEFLDPIDNPRYLLIRRGSSFGRFRQTDYFAVPAVMSQNRKDADRFLALWQKYIGDGEVIYTRNVEGRRLLLKARKDAFSALKRPRSKRVSIWQ